jgi:5-oxoprolinase (ATP-hydrolysing) subunit A
VVLGLAGSHLVEAGRAAGLRTAAEAFADRAYASDGSLVPRSVPGAVVHDVEAVVARAVRLVTTGRVTTVDGSEVAVQADSLCVHGDTPGALALVQAIRARFAAAGIGVAAFAP